MSTNKYNNDIKSYKGFGVVTPRYEKNLNYKSEITNLTDKNLDYTPPLFNVSYKNHPQDTNGYLNSKNYIKVPKTIDNYYYTSQQIDKIDKYPNYDKKSLLKFPPVLITTKPYINNKSKKDLDSKDSKDLDSKDDKDSKDSKNCKDDKDDKDSKDSKDSKSNNNKNSKSKKSKNSKSKNSKNAVLSDRLINKKWYNDRYLYSFEPRYNDVINKNRLYTWSYPFMPNTDNYYRDDINDSKLSPIIFDTPDNYEELPDYDDDSSNIEKIEEFESIKNNDNSNFIFGFVLLTSLIMIRLIIRKK